MNTLFLLFCSFPSFFSVFIITLRENKKLRMGNQSYQYLVMNMKSNKNVNINIWPSPDKLIEMFGANDKGLPKLNQEYANVRCLFVLFVCLNEWKKKKISLFSLFLLQLNNTFYNRCIYY